jgi:methylmalonyl-CoA mutase N-terminal domain/subunit
MRDRFGARDERSWMLRFHAQTAGSTLTAQQPDNNVVRVTLQALAAVMGGAQSLHTNSKDEALSLPAKESAQLALRTQQIIAYESGVPEVPDPFGGSIYIEELTDQIGLAAQTYLDQIEEFGGTLAAIEKGFIQREIQNSAYESQRAIEEGRQVVVGLNRFQSSENPDSTPFKIDPALERSQVERVRAVRASRSSGSLDGALGRLEQAARGADNLIPHIFDACRSFATVGEVSHRLRKIFGEYHDPSSA